MKKRLPCLLLSGLIALSLCLAPLWASAEEDDLSVEELIEDVDLDAETEEEAGTPARETSATPAGESLWTFPVALEDMTPDFVRLANKHYLLSKDFKPAPLVTVKQRKTAKDGSNTNNGLLKATGSKMQLQETCYEALVAMSEGARADGYYLYLKSAYRSYQTQNTMYYNRLKKNHGKDDGWVAIPGSSDHQTGLGCDVVPKKWRDKAMNGKMGAEPECVWMAEHCHEYGFILRYPADKEDVTEINYEPWHMRYVGIPAATYIMENGLCLEEFTAQLQEAIQAYLDAGGDQARVEAYIAEPNA